MFAPHAPVATATAGCQDCAKCLRACPVEAISFVNEHALIRSEACIACGRCTIVCPTHSQRVRDDVARVRELLGAGLPVAVSLAPSWVAAFPGLAPERMVAALRALGFAVVSETALGARLVSRYVAGLRASAPQRLWLSSACPSAVAWVRRHRPHLIPALTPVASPAQTHARLLRAWRPDLAAVVLISPCVAKKLEADEGADLDAALTFADLRRWWADALLDPATIPVTDDDRFVLGEAADGALYPIEGGMVASIATHGADAGLTACSGIADFDTMLAGLDPDQAGMFVEILACIGGCVNGPAMEGPAGILRRRHAVQAGHRAAPLAVTPLPVVVPGATWSAVPANDPVVDERALREALKSIGKRTPEDELDCSGCGYDTCRDMARALARNRAEPAQCVAWMRRLAQRKANTLLAAMPAGAVLVDRDLRIIEANRCFAELVGAQERADTSGLTGVPLHELAPFARQFRHVCDGHGDLIDRDLRYGNRVLHGSIFTVEPGQVVGAVLVDQTAPAMSRAQVAHRAGEAITKHLAAVQQIAYLLGENAAEVEHLLGSIVDAYQPERSDE